MGALRSRTTASGRFATLKHRLGPSVKAKRDAVEWALWQQTDDLPILVAAFRDPLEPDQESIVATLALLKGWLVDQWTLDEAKRTVSKHPRAQVIKAPRPGSPRDRSYRIASAPGAQVLVPRFPRQTSLWCPRDRLPEGGARRSRPTQEFQLSFPDWLDYLGEQLVNREAEHHTGSCSAFIAR